MAEEQLLAVADHSYRRARVLGRSRRPSRRLADHSPGGRARRATHRLTVRVAQLWRDTRSMTIPASDGGIGGLTVMAFESRRAGELESLIRRHGGASMVVPSMREVPLQVDAALDLLRELEAGEINVVIALTGVGLRTLAERCPPERLAASLAHTMMVARGPKPIAELRKLGLTPQVSVPEPNTWREILATIDAQARSAVCGWRSWSTALPTRS
ncbi:MAG: hypothetical protein E6F96_01715 [Actinobacteria bacterium]|nr:MAG: hypothetical protein E6F96_01715 [Actinomycetota bacterium]